MDTKIILENWNRIGKEDYRQIVNLNFIPRIGERLTYSEIEKDGWPDALFVVDIVHQIKGQTHHVFIMLSDDIENTNNFHYHNMNVLQDIDGFLQNNFKVQ
jgi:hypothetical protein